VSRDEKKVSKRQTKVGYEVCKAPVTQEHTLNDVPSTGGKFETSFKGRTDVMFMSAM